MLHFVFAATPGGFDYGTLAQYGVLGLLVIAFLIGKVVPGPTYERSEKKIEQLTNELAILRKAFEDDVLKALIRSTDVLGKFVDLTEILNQLIDEVAETRQYVAGLSGTQPPARRRTSKKPTIQK